jgi:hypothetical protein
MLHHEAGIDLELVSKSFAQSIKLTRLALGQQGEHLRVLVDEGSQVSERLGVRHVGQREVKTKQ